LKKVVVLAAIFLVIANGIRCLSTIRPDHWTAIYIISAGQIFNAAAGPFLMAPVSHLSAQWFADNERTTATAISTTANFIGVAVGKIFLKNRF